MKILFCIKAMNNPGGGAERVLAELANALSRRGHLVKVLTYESALRGSFYPLDAQVERISVELGSTVNRAKFKETVRRALMLRRKVRNESPDVAIGFMHSMFIVLGMALVGTKIPVIASEHIVPAHYRTRPIEAALLAIASFLVSCITCVSSQVRESYPWIVRRKIVVMPNPLSLPAAEVAAPSVRFARKLLLSVGRLSAQKDHATLIRAFKVINTHFPDWHLRIVGDGELRHALQSLIIQLEMTNCIELVQSTSDMEAEYSRASVLVQPSVYESFGLTVAEALSRGIPVIGFADCQGINELVVNGRNGILVETACDRVTGLAHALKKYIADESLRMSMLLEPLPQFAEHSISSVAEKWEELIEARVRHGNLHKKRI